MNTCINGYIHEALKNCKNYHCGEYLDGVKSGDCRDGVLCVDLCDIPFEDDAFDLIISEDVLEHISRYEKALKEIRRVLKPGGCHIFTVPVHEGRKTLDRTGRVNIYHGDPLREAGCIVVTDWGEDIAEILKEYHYQVNIYRKHIFYKPEEITNADFTYNEYLKKQNCMEQYFKYNSIVIQTVKCEEKDMSNSEKIFTGERFIPGINDKQLEIEHYQRYISIKEAVKDKIVLDAACGEGYGSRILAETARQVTGIDISEDTVHRAAEKYADCDKLSFLVSGIDKLPFEDDSIDVVVSFETVEHVSEELQAGFLKEIKRVLRPDGFLIMSTPNKEIYTDLYHYTNEFHVKEFYKDEFVSFLKKFFSNVKLYNQYFEVVSLIDEVNGENKNIYFHKDREKYKQEGKYYIAIAANECFPEESISSVFMNEFPEYQEKIKRIVELQEDVEKRNSHIFKLDEEIKEKNQYILQLQSDNKELAVKIDEKEKLIEQQKIIVEDLLKKVQEQEKKIENLLKEKNDQNDDLKSEVIRRGEHILKLDKEIEELREYRQIAETELNSRTYKFAVKLRKTAAFLMPLGSRRRKAFGAVFKIFKCLLMGVRLFRPARIRKIFRVLRVEGIRGIGKHIEKAWKAEKNLLFPCHNPVETDRLTPRESLDEYDELNFIKYSHPQVSIIIPVYNQFEYTYRCLESILKNSGDVAYEVIIADDNSTDFTREIQQKVHNIVQITNVENLRFLLNCNHAADYAKGEYILFLNNDTQVQPNWLKPMIELLKSDKTIGMTGAKLIYPDGLLQEAGGIVWKDASAWNYGNRRNPEDAEYNYVKDVDFISGACIMIRKKLWKAVKGFDERFSPAYYEDVDLAFKVRERGFRVVYQPLSVVIHFEGVSNGTNISDGQKAYQVQNKSKFYNKWKETLEKENFINGTDVFLAKDRSRFKKHILVVDHYVPHFDKDAGGRGTFMYLQLFVEMGMQVTFIGDNYYKHEPYTTLLNQEGIEILYGVNYAQNHDQWIKENGKYFDYVYLQRPHIAVKYIDIVKKYTKAKIIYYDVDLCHVREMRQYEITKDEALLKSAERWKEVEFGLIEKADVVHVVGSYEEEYLRKFFPDKPIRNIPLYTYSDIKKDANKDFDNRKDILFVGGFGHPPNEDAVLWFAQNIYPKIVEKYSDIKWYIVGSKPTEAIQALANEHIIIKGFVSEEELCNLYNRCKVDIVPLRYGAGVKGKVLEAIYYQIPLITTSVGAEGLSRAENAYWIADNADDFIKTFLDIYEDTKKLYQKSENCKMFIRNHFTKAVALDILKKDI